MFSDYFQLKRNLYRLPEKPLGAFLYITNKCNLKCSFCEIGIAEKQPDKDMSSEDVFAILRQLVEWDVKTLYITGGEPFLRKDIWKVLQFCIENRITVSHITTNGTLFENLSEEQRKILKASTGLIQISIDSPKREEHDAGRGIDGVFDKITNFLKKHDRSELPKIQFSSFITEENYKNVPDLIRFAAEEKADHINFTPVNFASNFPELGVMEDKNQPQFSNALQQEDLMKILREALDFGKTVGQSSNLEVLMIWIKEYFQYEATNDWFFEKVMQEFICSKPFNYIHINYYGDLMACSLIEGGENIRGKDIKTAWQKLAEKYRQKLLKKEYFPECKSCYCDFPTNFRNSLAYHPFANRSIIFKLALYYLKRRSR